MPLVRVILYDNDGNIDNLKAVLIGATKTFSTTLETTVITVGAETFTINDKTFNAQSNTLTIATESGNAFLTNGKVQLKADTEINTRRTNDDTITNEKIATTTGTLTVEVSNNSICLSMLQEIHNVADLKFVKGQFACILGS